MNHRRMDGVTLVELMIVLSIISILATMAAPSFVSMIASQQIKTAASSIQSSLNLTRAEALKRNASVTLSANAGGNWKSGWRIVDPVSNVVLHTTSETKGITIVGPDAVTFQRSGRVSAAASTTFKLASSSTPEIRCVEVSPSGVGTITKTGC